MRQLVLLHADDLLHADEVQQSPAPVNGIYA
jgi:hypothetical protein